MEKYLDKCLTSLVINDKELMKKLEVLVIIDGAKDRSSEIAHIYQDKYLETFRVIDKENGNYGSCINRGLKEAIGKYIKILDADDLFATTFLENFLKFLIEVDTDLVWSDYKIFYEESNRVSFRKLAIKPYEITDACMLFNNAVFINSTSMHSLAYNKKVFESLNYKQTEGISYTDQEWLSIPMINVRSISYFPEVVYEYRMGRAGQTMNPSIIVKHISDLRAVIFSLARNYEQVKSRNHCNKFLRGQIDIQLNFFYSLYLNKMNYMTREDIISFDRDLNKISNDVYKFAEGYSLAGYDYVKELRKDDFNKTIMIRTMYIMDKLFKRILNIAASLESSLCQPFQKKN